MNNIIPQETRKDSESSFVTISLNSSISDDDNSDFMMIYHAPPQYDVAVYMIIVFIVSFVSIAACGIIYIEEHTGTTKS
ncbi:hypothetical protein NEPAR06_1190 [Nematocida parisii]|uniref:uncharacterized protein n=1 Tax=Nematocida parisii (strain ERTm1 / ATCC PRA-289) TaxID=881290 RepID=UPI000264B818|nr:uncharacterized protein NEPG_00853 [Nematocida parisii ERTm1]KAI5128603.1 hypothetical protein NEPAR08_1314 [Nematocida parisii]EIJ94186.1 hypothetical protein NEPG_00853 [Nematocida parisii ERTm1]KAI5128920.1 hypothetical protein NEPAR03_1411 [Nematocida parisii]KAI5141470.1 hypothetical protein NEPAR04_0971 [Nematocida parisii]KAI5144833.1 hypothetical protein NEPAR07_1291 [Nematocida parisii]|eukprot:XP_013058682.1 hypothetical protein NEPG_00853 [Nematocida parisii ERTm1]